MGFTERPPVKPLIAAVEGFGLAGGMELALACDLIVASKDGAFGIPEVKRGLVAGGGGLLRLPQRIPPAIAMELALTGERLSAERAKELGLVNVARGAWKGAGRRDRARRERSPRTARLRSPRPSRSSSRRATGTPRRCGPSRPRSWRRSSCPTTPRKVRSLSPKSARRSGRAPDGFRLGRGGQPVVMELPLPDYDQMPLNEIRHRIRMLEERSFAQALRARSRAREPDPGAGSAACAP